jgi:hypothetical protein
MHKHPLLYATLLGLLLPLSAAAREPSDADAADHVAVPGDALPSIADEPAMEPVYAPGQSLPPPYRGGYPGGGYPGGGYGEDGGCPSCGHEDCQGCGDDDCGCGDCGCCCTPCCCGPHVTARVNGLYLKRESPDSVPLISDLVTGVALLDANQFEFDDQPGVEGTLVYQIDRCWGVEARYLWLDDWTSSLPVAIPATGAFINTFLPTVVGGPTVAAVDYRSRLQTAEISARRSLLPCLGLTAGFRYVQFDEALSLGFQANPAAALPGASARFKTTNDLYGFQLGGDVLFKRWHGLRVDGFAKAGVYWNDAQANVTFLAPPGIASAGNADVDRPAFLYEAGLFAGYQVTCHWAVRAGYQIMFLDNVATASSLVPQTGPLTLAPIPINFNLGDGILIRGYSAGVEARY